MTNEIKNARQARKILREALEAYSDVWSSTEGGKVINLVCLAEVATPDGGRSLLELSAGAMDDQVITSWARDGMLFNALHDEWWRKRGDDD